MRLDLKTQIFKGSALSSQSHKNITYSEQNWADVISRYDLHNPLEIIIKEEMPTNHSNTKKSSQWLSRAITFSILMVAIGNLPVQSHLAEKQSTQISHSFEIKTDDFENNGNEATQNTYYSLASVSELDEENVQVDTLSEPEELTLPAKALETYAGTSNDDNSSSWVTYKVKSYDNPTNIFYKIGHQKLLKPLQKFEEINTNIKALKKGSIVRANTKDGELVELIFTNNNKSSFVINKEEDGYVGAWRNNIFEIRQARASFTINNGLFLDGKKAGIAKGIVKQIVKVFDWDIDFSHDVRVGDKVTAVFEEIYHDGDKVDTRNLLAAEFINKGREFRAIRYTYKDGKSDYFTPEGREMKKAFIRTPIEHARVSSHFNPGRFHPRLHKIRAHKGTDFAARTGTPIMATGNGVIKSIGRKGGFGRTIVIQHREGYTTTYAHMSRYKRGLKAGSKVYQGDTIGYVGSSGLATGPHLHYEFHHNGKAANPMTVKLPNSMSLNRAELRDFRNKAIGLVMQLNVLQRFVKADIEIDSAFGG